MPLMIKVRFHTNGAPSGTIDCLQGNMLARLQGPRLFAMRAIDLAFEWMARSVDRRGSRFQN